ncbi:MAG: zinc ribbon domain-containing protein [Oscillospiraceae bacterium]|nr:zinc ribbon domain-containing protein [Oscillospiraceae bacterium]
MYCSKCGYKNAENSKFCNSCGQTMAGSNEVQPPQQNQKMDSNMIVCCIIGLLGTIGFLYGIVKEVDAYQQWGRYYEPSFSSVIILLVSIFSIVYSLAVIIKEAIKRKQQLENIKSDNNSN